MEIALPWIASVVAGLWIGSYFSPYLKKRAENLATHEDINKLVDQVKATTEATKSIEAQISNDVWGRQRRWELTREVLFELTRAVGKAEFALKFAIVQLGAIAEGSDAYKGWESEKSAFKECLDSVIVLNELRLKVIVVSNVDVMSAFITVNESYTNAVLSLNITDFDKDKTNNLLKEFMNGIGELQGAIRKELAYPME